MGLKEDVFSAMQIDVMDEQIEKFNADAVMLGIKTKDAMDKDSARDALWEFMSQQTIVEDWQSYIDALRRVQKTLSEAGLMYGEMMLNFDPREVGDNV